MDDKKLKNDISISLADSINGIIVVDSVIQPSPNSTSVLKRLTEETSPVTVPVPDEEIEIPIEFDKCLTVDVSHIGKVCRTCLCEKPNMHSLFETWEVETIAEMLTSFAAVQLSFGDGLPESVCKECIELVSKCFAFKQLCERSESILRCFITQGHLQGMKLDPDISVIAGTISKTINERENRPANENEQDLINYDVYLDEEFQDSASPEQPSLIINEVLGKDNTETLNVNACPPVPKKNLSIITNPAITISPNSQLKEKDNKKKTTKKNKTLNNTITSKDTNDLNNLSRINKNKLVKKLQQTSPVADVNESTGTKVEREKTELSFTCGSCGKQFPNNHRLLRHERIHQEEKLYSCDVCKKGFNEPRDYHRHLVKHSLPKDENAPVANENTFGCPNCHLTFSSEGDLHIHSSVHLATGDKIVCQHCKKEFATTLQLKRHVRIHLSDKPHKCSFCQKGFAEMGSLTRHFRLHTGETRERKHVCDVCNKAYYDRNSLRIHLRIHTGEKPWECLDCGKRFIDSRLLNSHRRTHSDIKPYACNTCDRRFKHESTLTTHKRTHTGEKPYVCSVCGNAFVQSSNLSLHMRTHTRERPYGCQFCKKRFSSSSALTTHTRTHTGEKPYVCPICFKRFARYDMRSHMRTHTGEKPFGCSLCGRHFVSQSQLQQHLRMHTGERPFVCIICGKGCTTSFYLKKHMSKTHNMVTVNLNPGLPKEDQKLDQSKFIAPADCIMSPKIEEKPVNSDIVISSNQVLSIDPNNTIALTGNNLNVVSVTNSGELGITASDLGISTLTGQHQMVSTEVNVGTIVTNTLIADDKLYQIDPELLRIHHVSANLVHSSQLTISELTNANS